MIDIYSILASIALVTSWSHLLQVFADDRILRKVNNKVSLKIENHNEIVKKSKMLYYDSKVTKVGIDSHHMIVLGRGRF